MNEKEANALRAKLKDIKSSKDYVQGRAMVPPENEIEVIKLLSTNWS